MYVLECDDQTLYTGITTDLKRRTEQHNSSLQGAKYTRGRRPVKMVYSCEVPNKSEAQKEEYRIRKLTKEEKREENKYLFRAILPFNKFDFQTTILAHGWVHLDPFKWDYEKKILSRPICVNNMVLDVNIKLNKKQQVFIYGMAPRSIADNDRNELKTIVSFMLRLNEDFSLFHEICRKHSCLNYVKQKSLGGILRSPTTFEDIIKTICTTNCSWNNTKLMCSRFCKIDSGAFPTPLQVIKLGTKGLMEKIRVGYRAETIMEVSRLFESGTLPLAPNAPKEAWVEKLSSIKGLGPYSVRHILVLLGFYDEIPVDSEVTDYLSKVHFNGRKVPEKEAVKYYNKYGSYKYLAYKFMRIDRKMNYSDDKRNFQG